MDLKYNQRLLYDYQIKYQTQLLCNAQAKTSPGLAKSSLNVSHILPLPDTAAHKGKVSATSTVNTKKKKQWAGLDVARC